MNKNTATVTIGETTFDIDINIGIDYNTLGSLRVITRTNENWTVELPASIFDPKTADGAKFLEAIKAAAGVEFESVKRNTRKNGRTPYAQMDLLLVGTNRSLTVRVAREGFNQWDADETARIQAQIDAERDAEALRKVEAIEIFKGYAAQGIRVLEAEVEVTNGFVYRVTAHRWSSESDFRYEAWAINTTGPWDTQIALGKTQYPSSADLADQKAKADQFAVAVMC